MAKKKIVKLTDEQYYNYIMGLKGNTRPDDERIKDGNTAEMKKDEQTEKRQK